MEFDVNTMNRIKRDETNLDIFKSKYLKESVPYIHYFEDGDLYCIPVDGKRIYDPLFNKGWYIIGTIVGSHLRSKPDGIYQSEDDGSKMDDDEIFLFDIMGKPTIVPARLNVPHDVYSDGENAYYVWWYYLVRVDYMILTDPISAAEYHYGDTHRFLTGAGNEEIWEEKLKPNLIEKPLLPMLVENAQRAARESMHELGKMKQKADYANKVYTELRNIMEKAKTCHLSDCEVEDISAAR